MHNRWTTRTC